MPMSPIPLAGSVLSTSPDPIRSWRVPLGSLARKLKRFNKRLYQKLERPTSRVVGYLFRRHSPLQLLRPVLDEDDLRDAGGWLRDLLNHEKPLAVWGNVVSTKRPVAPERTFEQHTRRAGRKRGRGRDRDGHHADLERGFAGGILHVIELASIPSPSRGRSIHIRHLLLAIERWVRLHIYRLALKRGIGDPAIVGREIGLSAGASRCHYLARLGFASTRGDPDSGARDSAARDCAAPAHDSQGAAVRYPIVRPPASFVVRGHEPFGRAAPIRIDREETVPAVDERVVDETRAGGRPDGHSLLAFHRQARDDLTCDFVGPQIPVARRGAEGHPLAVR